MSLYSLICFFDVLVLSGLSISRDVVDASIMAETYTNCSNVLPDSVYILDDMATLRLAAMHYAHTTCKGIQMSRVHSLSLGVTHVYRWK